MDVIKVEDTGFSLDGPAPTEQSPSDVKQTSDKAATDMAKFTKRDMGASISRMAMNTLKRGGERRKPVNTTQMTTEERGKWQSLVLTLTRYGASRRFGDQLRSFGFNLTAASLRNHTVVELEDLLDRARICCQQATVEGMFSSAALSAVGLAEGVVCSTPGLRDKVLLKGLTESLKQDEGFMAALEQLSIDYGSFVSCPPEYRLMLAFTAAAGRTHAMNLFLKKRCELVAAAAKQDNAAATKEADSPPISTVGSDSGLEPPKGTGKPAIK